MGVLLGEMQLVQLSIVCLPMVSSPSKVSKVVQMGKPFPLLLHGVMKGARWLEPALLADPGIGL